MTTILLWQLKFRIFNCQEFTMLIATKNNRIYFLNFNYWKQKQKKKQSTSLVTLAITY